MPHLANPETAYSKIIERYIKLCVEKYGIKTVRNELDRANNTVDFVDSTYYKFWGVEVFGAFIDLGISQNKSVTQGQADTIIRHMDIYRLVN